MSLEWLAYVANYHNALLWIYFKELDMAKFCKEIGGFVANDYACGNCNQCAGRDK